MPKVSTTTPGWGHVAASSTGVPSGRSPRRPFLSILSAIGRFRNNGQGWSEGRFVAVYPDNAAKDVESVVMGRSAGFYASVSTAAAPVMNAFAGRATRNVFFTRGSELPEKPRSAEGVGCFELDAAGKTIVQLKVRFGGMYFESTQPIPLGG